MENKKFLLLILSLISISFILLVIVEYWYPDTNWGESLDLLVIPKEHIGNLATIIFGITGGVLALIGLVAIFVSINSQHKIQKCRELYWRIINLSFKKADPFNSSEEMSNLIWEYTKISANDDEDFATNIIKGSQKTILYVLAVWTLFIPFTLMNYLILGAIIIGIGYFGGVFVLLFFHNILGRLNNLVDIGNLRETDKILNLAENNDFQGLLLLLNNIQLERENIGGNDLIIWPSLHAPIKGFKFTLTGIQYVTWESARETLEKKITLKCEWLKEMKSKRYKIKLGRLGYTDILDTEFDIEDHSEAIKQWIDNGMFWSSEGETFVNIHRNEFDFGRLIEEGDPGYEITMAEVKSGKVNAVVPANTYAIRLATCISMERKEGQYLEFLWEFPFDLNLNPRIVAVQIGGNGRVLTEDYWNASLIEEDFINIDSRARDKALSRNR